MKNLKRVSALVFAAMTLMWVSQPSHALGFGRPSSQAVLGDTLRVTVPLRLEPGEDLNDDCLAADVYFGDEKIAAASVRTALQDGKSSGERVLKVSTTALINEPVVTVYLAAGCHARITRKFVAFADPPGMAMPSFGEAPVAMEAVGADERAAALVASAPRTKAPARRAAASGQATAKEGQPKAAPKKAPRDAETMDNVALAEAPRTSARAARMVPEPEGVVRPSQRAQLRAEQRLSDANRAPAGDTGGRLVLDSAEPQELELPDLRMSASMGVMLQADDASPEVLARRRAAAALWQALNATPESVARDRQRVGDLEKRLAELTAENQRSKQALADAQGLGGSGKWIVLLGAIALIAVGVALYLARKAKAQGKPKDAWYEQADSRPREPTDADAAELERTSAFVRTPDAEAQPDGDPPSSKSAMPPAPDVFMPPPPSLAKQKLHEAVPDVSAAPSASSIAMAAMVSQSAEPLREVSVEELIDLEQQAEFFVVLGQDDAAIGLLESHVTQTTGASPLPYLKLLEIYRRLGRKDDYERVQAQFNPRFNAHAPAWDADPQQGHTLDEYPGVVERLQSLWSVPAKAMEVLEKSLTRPDASTDTFDLSAYRELLFLYAVARDLSERELHDRANIDLLLPSLDGVPVDERAQESATAGVVEDSGEPLMVTRPIKAQPEALPSLSLDFHLDDLPEPGQDASAVKH